MRQFIKFVLATLVALGIFIFLTIVIVISMVPKPEGIADNAILKIDLDKQIIEREVSDLWSSLRPSLTGAEGSIGLLELREAIKKAKEDAKIKGIVLNLQSMPAGFATLEELRNTLIDFKTSKKFIVAYSESYSEGTYYLASVADKIFLPESGLVELNGLGVELLYFKGALEKLEIKPELFPVGKYKSAIEPLKLDKMSEANRIQVRSFLNSIYGNFIQHVAEARGIDAKTLRLISDSVLVRNSEDALKYKLITDIGYFDGVEDFVRTKLNADKGSKINTVSLEKYSNSIVDESSENSSKVAVIFASGNIMQGEADNSNIGSEKFAAEIRKARLDDNVKAVVLRINSPGGSALASDVIWREVDLTSRVKPIIASMSDLAASGGYYIAMACDTIVAQPNTITGSIGVFGVLFNGKDFLKNKLGITSDREMTGNFSDVGSFAREMTDYERKIIQKEVEKIYVDFKTKAARGRDTDTATIEKNAQGRVWSGIEAKSNGLIDMYGGLDDAVKIAAQKSKLGTDYDVVYLPEEKNPLFNQFMKQLGGDAMIQNNDEFGKLYPYIKTIKDIRKFEGIQARLPFEIIIK